MDGADPAAALTALLALMTRLRDPQSGCPWDRVQDFASIAPYTIEEAYEVRDAIERSDPGKLCEELGDLLFQVVFHARLAEERDWFDFAAVAVGIHAKLVRRHPHVFAGAAAPAAAADQSRQWEEHKARERAQTLGDAAALADVPLSLPALMRAAKLGRRAARVGFDWERADQVRDKVGEELAELDAALAATGGKAHPEVIEELGDLLFTLANWSIHLAIDPEEALRMANAKFERRFECMERLAAERGMVLATLTSAQWDGLWREAKQQV